MVVGTLKYAYSLYFVLVALSVVLVDQVVKFLVVKFTPEFSAGIFRFHLIYNTGAGFGILQGMPIILGMVSLAVAVAVVYYYPKIGTETFIQIVWGAFLGGVVGNMIDRFVRQRVVDFVMIGIWPAFNIADMMLTFSAICLVVYYWRYE